MPAVPHYPTEEPRERKDRPDLNEIVDRILDRDDPTFAPRSA